MFKITREWIHAHKTPRGGWTSAQLAVIGVAWPPTSGWVTQASGIVISDEQRARFEAYSPVPFRPFWEWPTT